MSKNFWANKRVFITGASGFIGRHLSLYLLHQGAKVFGLCRHASDLRDIKIVDVTQRRDLESVFLRFPPSVCFHLAGETLVEQGQKSPYETFYNNIVGTLNILELCRAHRVARLVIASTVHVYGDSHLPYTESLPPRPSRPYETSKTCTDLIAQSYADTFHLPVVIPRFVNIYGPGDLNFTRVIPKTIKSVLEGKSPTMWGGGAKREYLYIDDAIAAYDLLAQITDAQIEQNRIYNFGTGKLISVAALMRQIISLSGETVSIKRVVSGRPDELPRQLLSWNKAKQVLAWQPRVPLSEGLKLTLAWYRNYFKM